MQGNKITAYISGVNSFKKKGDKTIKQEKLICEIAVKNRKAMKWGIEILTVELTKDPNFKDYLLKYRAYTFQLRVELCKDLYIILAQRFEQRLWINLQRIWKNTTH